MGLENFVPEMWWGAIFERLRANLVHASTVNRDFQGILSAAGDEVHISEIEPIAVATYSKNTDITWSNTTSYTKTLKVDQAKYYARNLDAIDRVQANVDLMGAISSEAGYGMAKAEDDFVAALYTKAGNSVSAVTVTAGNILVNLSNMQYALDLADVPAGGRFLPIPPIYNQFLVQAAGGVVGHTGVPKVFSDNMIVNGYTGSLFGFDLLMTTRVHHTSTAFHMMGYNRTAIAFVGQLMDVELVQREDRFGQGLKALSLYGAEVIRPEAMVTCTATMS
jgi:hypothetical protein